MNFLKSLFADKTKWTHGIAVAVTGLIFAYGGYPPFHDLVNSYYARVPADVKVLGSTAMFLYGWYRNGQKPAQ